MADAMEDEGDRRPRDERSERILRGFSASLLLLVLATLPMVWVTLSYDCGPSRNLTGIQMLTGKDVPIKGYQSNSMTGGDETPIDGTWERGPSIRLWFLVALGLLAVPSVNLRNGGYGARGAAGLIGALCALTLLFGWVSGHWTGTGPAPGSEGGWGAFVGFVTLVLACAVNLNIARILSLDPDRPVDGADANGIGVGSFVLGVGWATLITVVLIVPAALSSGG